MPHNSKEAPPLDLDCKQLLIPPKHLGPFLFKTLPTRKKDAPIITKKPICDWGAHKVRFPINKLLYTKMFYHSHVETLDSQGSLLLAGYDPTAWGLSQEAAEILDKKGHTLQSCRCSKSCSFSQVPDSHLTFRKVNHLQPIIVKQQAKKKKKKKR